MFRQDPLPKLTLNIYQGTPCSALVLAALRAAPDLADRSIATKPGPQWKRRADRPARYAVHKSATTKINYRKKETATFWDRHRRGLAYFRRGARTVNGDLCGGRQFHGRGSLLVGATGPLRLVLHGESIEQPGATDRAVEFDFSAGVPEIGLFPFDSWRRLQGREWRGSAAGTRGYVGPAGAPELREAIATQHRCCAWCTGARPDDVVITNGTQQGVEVVAPRPARAE